MESTLTGYEIAEWIAHFQMQYDQAERKRLEHIAQASAMADLNSRPSSR